QTYGTMKHLGERHIVDKAPVPKGKLASLITLRVGSDPAAVFKFGGSFASQRFGCELDRVDYLHVTGAAAVVHAQHTIDLIVGGIGSLIDEVFGPNNNARRAKSTLESAGGDERIGKRLPFEFAKAFKRRDVL